jgi:hypothetical protein
MHKFGTPSEKKLISDVYKPFSYLLKKGIKSNPSSTIFLLMYLRKQTMVSETARKRFSWDFTYRDTL